MKRYLTLNSKGLLISSFIIINVALGRFLNIQEYSSQILLPIIAALSIKPFLLEKKKSKILLAFGILIFYGLIGVYFLQDYTYFLDNFKNVFFTLLASFGAYVFVQSEKKDNYIHISYIIASLLLIYFAYLNQNYSLLGFSSLKGSRDRFLFNANYYSYISYFANISILFLHLKYKTKTTFSFTIILPILFIVLAFITQSRSGLLFVILINSCYWFFIDKPKQAKSFRALFRIIALLLISIFLVFKFLNIYSNSNIQQRVSNNSEDARSHLAKKGIEVFFENPFTGVGLGQFPLQTKMRQFTHNSYAEILSEQGILGGILLLFILIVPFVKGIKRLKKDKANPFLKLQLLFFATFILYNNFYVFYKFPYAMFYFFTLVAIQDSYDIKGLNSKENVVKI